MDRARRDELRRVSAGVRQPDRDFRNHMRELLDALDAMEAELEFQRHRADVMEVRMHEAEAERDSVVDAVTANTAELRRVIAEVLAEPNEYACRARLAAVIDWDANTNGIDAEELAEYVAQRDYEGWRVRTRGCEHDGCDRAATHGANCRDHATYCTSGHCTARVAVVDAEGDVWCASCGDEFGRAPLTTMPEGRE